MADIENKNEFGCNRECDECPNFDSCEEFNDENLIILNDDEGNQTVFELLDTIEYKEEYYIVLYPLEEDDCTEVVILKVRMDENDEEVYDSIEDDDLIEKLFEMFKERNADLFAE